MGKNPHLRNFEHHDPVYRILRAGLQAADPAGAIQRSVRVDGTRLVVSGHTYELTAFKQVYLLSLGKAGWRLAQALEGLIGKFLSRRLVITKDAGHVQSGAFELIEAGHPLPDARSLRAGQVTLEFLRELGRDDLLICAISGGGSSLMSAPHPPIDLVDLQVLSSRLLACGASIQEINTLRRHLDLLKGGGILRHTPAGVLGLILSDVPGNSLADIASGPTAADPTTRTDAFSILRKYNLSAECPPELLRSMETAEETLKPQDSRFENVQNVLIGTNQLAIQGALKQAAAEGLHPYLLRTDLAGEARQVSRELCQSLRWACRRGEPVARPFCMLAGGETTVTLRGQGRGGRNTELALAAVMELVGFPNVLLATLATDGEDGSTDAAGAMVDGQTWRRAETLGLQHPLEYLERNDSYTFFAALDDLIKTGPTGTNVNDLVFLFGF